MAKRIMLFSMLALSLSVQATDVNVMDTTLVNTTAGFENTTNVKTSAEESRWLSPQKPTFLDDVVFANTWQDNWFVNVSGGVSVFAGTPLGCEDMFGRMKPALGISVGKWFTPAIGSRLAFQGMQFVDCQLKVNDYRSLHADFLYNLSSHWMKIGEEAQWDVIPFIGCGIIHKRGKCCNPFTVSYGVMGRYRLTERLHLTMEIGGLTTFQNFDGEGCCRKLGDNLFNLTAGLSMTIGKSGFKRIADAQPYIRQNDYLMGHLRSLQERNRQLSVKLKDDERIMAELKKILEIDGLLDSSGDNLPNVSKMEKPSYPINDYSGLNSLRARLNEGRTGLVNKEMSGTSDLADGSFTNVKSDKAAFPAVYFFFKIGTSELTDESQLVNLDEIARISSKHNLRIRVTGSADSATGNVAINDRLGNSRAATITRLLVERGVSADNIIKRSEGGTSKHLPIQRDRNAYIELLYPGK